MSVLSREKGTWVLLSFIAFFGVIVAVNAVFITTALKTHSGVVTKQPYEKGLAYDEILQAAQNQPDLQQEAIYENGVLRWSLKTEDGQPLNADVSALLVRPVQGGYDYEAPLLKIGNGIYEAALELPMKGRWDALLKAQWNNSQYQIRYSFIAN